MPLPSIKHFIPKEDPFMSEQLEKLSVIELRQKAKEWGVKLGAGINKQGIIEKLQAAMPAENTAQKPAAAAETPAEMTHRPIRSASIITDDEMEDEDVPVLTARTPAAAPVRRPAAPAPGTSSLSNISAKAPAFTMEGSRAWHNPRAFQGGNSYQHTAGTGWSTRPVQSAGDARGYNRPAAAARPEAPLQQNRPAQPASYPNRFGPDQGTAEETAPRSTEYRQTHYQPAQQDYTPRQDYARTDYAAPRETPAPSAGGSAYRPQGTGYPQREVAAPVSGGIADLLAAGECGDGEGVLELHPDGYGFLRTGNYLPGKQDIYISNAQIRRFGLRTGDYIAGKTRPQRDADRYCAMLYITEINGRPPEENPVRPRFDELTPIYPQKRLALAGRKESDPVLRLIDCMCPVGYGQRMLITGAPRTGKSALLRLIAAAIARSHPKVHVMLLVVDERPEEAAIIRESFKGELVVSTFDEMPENQMRMCDLALERAQRLVEQKRDVVILLDSLTRTARASQATGQGFRPSLSGKLRKLFGAARNTKEAGTLTVLAAADTGTPLYDALCEEFRNASNAELVLDAGMEGPISPALNIHKSQTFHDEWQLPEAEKALAGKLRALFAQTETAETLKQIGSMLEKTDSNDELAEKFDIWMNL